MPSVSSQKFWNAEPTAGASSRIEKKHVGVPFVIVAHFGAPSQPCWCCAPGAQTSLFGEAMYFPHAS
jgi:hypothetical protein